MNRLTAYAALLVLLLAAPALAADPGWHPNNESCTGSTDTTPAIQPGKSASWCPQTTATLTALVRVADMADCNWDGDPDSSTAGTATLAVTKCSGSTSTSCDTPMTDSSSVVWTVTSDSEDGRFSLTSGIYLITASETTATGRLLCTGR